MLKYETDEGPADAVASLPAALPPLVVKEWMGSADQKNAWVYMTNTLETRRRPVRPSDDKEVKETWRLFWIQDGEFGRAYGWVLNTPQVESIWQTHLCSGFAMGTVFYGAGIIELIVPDTTVYLRYKLLELHYECVPVRDARK